MAVDELVRAGIGVQAVGHETGNAQGAAVLAVLREELALHVVAVAGIGRDLDQRLHDGLRRREPGGHPVGLVFALAAVARQRELEDHAVQAQQVVRHDGQATAAHLPGVLVELLQLGAQRRAAARVAAAQVGQLVRQHGVRLGLVEHAQQRDADEQRAARQRLPGHARRAPRSRRSWCRCRQRSGRAARSDAAGQLANAVPQARRIGLASSSPSMA
jgi:hypothetical protein